MRGVVDRVEGHKNQMEVGVLDVKRRIQLGCVERRRYQMETEAGESSPDMTLPSLLELRLISRSQPRFELELRLLTH